MKDANGYDLSRITFLVVDENEHMRMLINSVLRTLGAKQIGMARDGGTALAEIEARVPDVILTGLGMKPLSGIELIRKVREGETSADRMTPIIVVSSYTEQRFVAAARDAGIDEFLAKPVSAKAVYSHVVRVIDKRRPFVHAEPFFGPDRRRRKATDPEKHRRAGDKRETASAG